jgi:hypothetical protein
MLILTKKRKAKVVHTVKRKVERGDDLPVGLQQRFKARTSKLGEDGGYYYIRASVSFRGKQKTCERIYGKARTREQAVAECLEWRLKELERRAGTNK